MSIACLPWYDFEEIRPITDRFWFSLVERLTEGGFAAVPQRLMREVDHGQILAHPDLLLSQTCGYVVATTARDLVTLVGTPWYSAPGCREGYYTSVVLVRDEVPAETLAETRGLRCAVNEPWSHSGVNALRSLVAPLHDDGRFFSKVTRAGSHVASLCLLQRGDADLACVDRVTAELVRRHRPHLLAGLHPVCETEPAPAPPFVTAATAADGLVTALRDAIGDVLTAPGNAELCETLLLDGVELLEVESYDGMVVAANRAREAGYSELFLEGHEHT